MKLFGNVFLGLLVSLFIFSGCSKSEDKKGPMEKAGQAVDKAMDQAKGNFTEAGKLLGIHPNYVHRLIRNLNLREHLKS